MEAVFHKLNYYALAAYILTPKEITIPQALTMFGLKQVEGTKLRKNEFKNRAKRAKPLDEQAIVKMYQVEKKCIRDIARVVKASDSRVSRILKDNNCVVKRKGWN